MPICSRRNEPVCTAVSPRHCNSSRPTLLRRADRAGELAFHLDRGGRQRGARSRHCSPQQTPPRPSPRRPRSATSSEPSSCGTRSASSRPTASRSDRLWQAADIATSTVGNERARAAGAGRVRARAASARCRMGPRTPRSLPVGHRSAAGERDRVRSGSGAAGRRRVPPPHAVYAGLAQAEALAGTTPPQSTGAQKVFELVAVARRQPCRVEHGPPGAGHRPQQPGRPGHRRRALSSGDGRCTDRAEPRPRRALPVRHPRRRRRLRGRAQRRPGRGRRGASAPASIAATAATSTRSPRDALVRLGRWTEVAALLARHPLPDTLPVGRLQLARVQAVLAARRGDADRGTRPARSCAMQLPIDGWHAAVRERRRAPTSTWRSGTGTRREPSRARLGGDRHRPPRCCGRRGSRCSAPSPKSSETLDQRARRRADRRRRNGRPPAGSGSTRSARSPRVCPVGRSRTPPRTSPTPRQASPASPSR